MAKQERQTEKMCPVFARNQFQTGFINDDFAES